MSSPTRADGAAIWVQLPVDANATARVRAAGDGSQDDTPLAIDLTTGPASTIRLVGTCWALHRLVIDLDRTLTELSRRLSPPPPVERPDAPHGRPMPQVSRRFRP